MHSRRTSGICSILASLALTLVLALPVLAESGHGDAHGAPAAHGEHAADADHAADAHGGGHGEEGAHGGGHGDGHHACPEGAICLHPHAHEVAELPSAVDFVFASLAETLVQPSEAELIPTEEPGTFILKDESVNFIESGVGKVNPAEKPIENPIFAVMVSNPPGNLDGTTDNKKFVRFWITEVTEHELKIVRQVRRGDKPEDDGVHGPLTVSYKVNKEHTLTSNVWGTGLMGLNWTDVANIVFGFTAVLFIILMGMLATRKVKKIPSGFQAFMELIVGWLDTFTRNMIGPDNRKYLPLLGSIFMYVICMAYMGMIPGFKSPIALNLNTPLSVAICVFLFVQYHGIRQNGPGGYIKHLMGEPAWLAPLQMPLHMVGEVIKPISLSLRLFANITAEEVLIAALAFMLLSLPWFVPIPLQTLFFPLAMLFGFIQALVFMSLSAIYISQMSAHGDHHHDDHHHAEHGHH